MCRGRTRLRGGHQGRLFVEVAAIVALEKTLDELAHFTCSGGIQFLAGVLESVAHFAVQSQHELGVFLFLLLLALGHGGSLIGKGLLSLGFWEETDLLC